MLKATRVKVTRTEVKNLEISCDRCGGHDVGCKVCDKETPTCGTCGDDLECAECYGGFSTPEPETQCPDCLTELACPDCGLTHPKTCNHEFKDTLFPAWVKCWKCNHVKEKI